MTIGRDALVLHNIFLHTSYLFPHATLPSVGRGSYADLRNSPMQRDQPFERHRLCRMKKGWGTSTVWVNLDMNLRAELIWQPSAVLPRSSPLMSQAIRG